MNRRHTLPMLMLAIPTLASGDSRLHADDANAIVGTWEVRSDDGSARIEIECVDNEFVGRIAWLEHSTFPADDPDGMAGQPRVDRYNPNPELRDRSLVGLEVLKGLEFDGDGTWKDGRIYAPDTGKTYRARVRLKDDGMVEVRAFVKVLFAKIGRSVVAHPVPSPGLDLFSAGHLEF